MADPITLDPKEMQYYLQYLYQLPLVLREKGTFSISCPYCGESHTPGDVTGHVQAQCTTPSPGIAIENRFFHPNYGYSIMEFEKKDGLCLLTPLPYLSLVDLGTSIS